MNVKVEWNTVTWYSKLLAAILFVVVFYVGFGLGEYKDNIQPNVIVVHNQTGTKISTASYICDGGKVIIATYYDGGPVAKANPGFPPTPSGMAEVTLSDGRSMTLPQTISADGGRYAKPDDSFVFWSKGDTAFITEQNQDKPTYANCKVSTETAGK